MNKLIAHQDDNYFIINLYGLHNANLLRRFLLRPAETTPQLVLQTFPCRVLLCLLLGPLIRLFKKTMKALTGFQLEVQLEWGC